LPLHRARNSAWILVSCSIPQGFVSMTVENQKSLPLALRHEREQ